MGTEKTTKPSQIARSQTKRRKQHWLPSATVWRKVKVEWGQKTGVWKAARRIKRTRSHEANSEGTRNRASQKDQGAKRICAEIEVFGTDAVSWQPNQGDQLEERIGNCR